MPNFNVNSITSSEEISEKRYRNFMILLYPEWGNYIDILQDIKGSFKNYAYIKHMPEELEKKEHVHLLLSLDNPRSIESLSKRLQIDKRFIQSVKSLRASCRYLIHMDNEEKFQYALDQVIISKSFHNTFFKSFDDLLSDDEVLESIFAFLDSHKGLNAIILEVELSRFVCSNAYDRVFKRYYNTIVKYVSLVSEDKVNIIYIIYS